MYRVAIVSEGPADREILQAILDHYLDDYEPRPIQPPLGLTGGHAGPLGGGWRGVKAWCEQESDAHHDFAVALGNADILIIQVDADVACDADHDPTLACPPTSIRCDYVRNLVMGWLGRADLPERVLLCVPATATETWAFVALYPHNPNIAVCAPHGPPDCIECRPDIKQVVRTVARHRRPKLVVGAAGKLKNQADGYRAAATEITAGWQFVLQTCHEATLFHDSLLAVLP